MISFRIPSELVNDSGSLNTALKITFHPYPRLSKRSTRLTGIVNLSQIGLIFYLGPVT